MSTRCSWWASSREEEASSGGGSSNGTSSSSSSSSLSSSSSGRSGTNDTRLERRRTCARAPHAAVGKHRAAAPPMRPPIRARHRSRAHRTRTSRAPRVGTHASAPWPRPSRAAHRRTHPHPQRSTLIWGAAHRRADRIHHPNMARRCSPPRRSRSRRR
eukprot:6119152-Prymnesium_polylepis.2